jgi:hypothetical protein
MFPSRGAQQNPGIMMMHCNRQLRWAKSAGLHSSAIDGNSRTRFDVGSSTKKSASTCALSMKIGGIGECEDRDSFIPAVSLDWACMDDACGNDVR